MLKRKTRTSEDPQKALSISANEVVALGDDFQSCDENVKRRPEIWTGSQKEQSSGGLVLKLKRSSARLLSRLGLWNSGNSENYATTSSSLLDIDDSSSVKDLDPESESVIIRNNSMSSCKPFDNLPVKYEYRLSHKLSIFGSPTIIRRTKTRPRVGLGHGEGSCPVLSHNKSSSSLQESTDQFTEYSPIFSQTEFCSSLDDLSASFTLLSSGYENAQRLRSLSSKSAPSIHSLARFDIKPSIVTVESTAAAKVFFETHFNSINVTQNGRNQRLRELQEHLHALPFSDEERLAAHKAWIVQESDYLRQSRVLQSKSNRSHNLDTVSTAGYEVVRVLGQGSFGIVQLVREKSLDHSILSKKGRKANTSSEGRKHGRRFRRRSRLLSEDHGSRKGTLRKNQQNVYAMKVIRKAEMVRLCQEGHIRAEREFLTASERSKWIVPLIASFQDAAHLYLVMEYEVGGDFFGLLIQHGVLSESDTMWYVAEMILCVEEAHRLGWIHRDVKPENFLISASGHLKLADFGLAFDGHWSHNQAYFHNHRYSLISKLGIDIRGDADDQSESLKPDVTLIQQNKDSVRRHQLGEPTLNWRDRKERRRFARSIVGTSQYMAPEIVNGEPYDGRCDYWSIGIILYECLYGVTPFYRENRDDTKNCIRDHRKNLCFHRERLSDILISPYAINLIQQLLQRKEFRLSSRGYKINDCALWHGLHSTVYANAADLRNCHWNGSHVYKDDASDIKAHQWFRDIPWSEMLHRRPPYVPPERRWDDTSGPSEEKFDFVKLFNEPEKDPLNCNASTRKPDPILKADINIVKVDKDNNNNTARKRRNKEKRRARDKILRDAVVGPIALELRTKGAFMGYTWRRPKSVRDVLEIERGRGLLSDRF